MSVFKAAIYGIIKMEKGCYGEQRVLLKKRDKKNCLDLFFSLFDLK